MAIYKHYDDVDQRGNRFSYYDSESVEGTNERCNCGGSCGDKCFNDTSNSRESNSDFFNDAFVEQEANQLSFMDQESAELIWVKESCNIKVFTTDTQIGVSLQAALQLAIALVLNISIADGQQRDAVSQELMQEFSMGQRNKQKIFIYNTKDAKVTTKDTDLAINIQLMLQVLVALALLIEIL